MIGRNGERGGSGISVLAARHDDNDDDKLNILVSSFVRFTACQPLSVYFILKTVCFLFFLFFANNIFVLKIIVISKQ